MSGKVTDVSKEALIGATVKAVHTPTGTVYYATTQPNGRFAFQNLRIGGPYTVEISYVGFNPEKISNISLVLGEERILNATMREDALALGEVLVIGDKNPIISGNRTGAQEIITRDKMDKLPTLNRSLTDFTKLTPMSSGGNFAGTSYRFNNVTVDGASFNNSFGLASSLGAKGTEPISLEAIE
ncbi:MAG: carboxypeptidase-like regulatory domain-containing protein, partial [Bacteroides sp.]